LGGGGRDPLNPPYGGAYGYRRIARAL